MVEDFLMGTEGKGPFMFVCKKRFIDGVVTQGEVTRRFESIDAARECLHQGAVLVGEEVTYSVFKALPEQLVFTNTRTGTTVSVVIWFEGDVEDGVVG